MRQYHSPEDIIHHNFLLSMIMVISISIWSFLSYTIHPLKLLRYRTSLFLLITILLPFLIINSSHHYQIFALQFLLQIAVLGSAPAESIFVKHFPVFKRFTTASFLYALSRALMYIITSFGLVYLTEAFGYWGIWIIALPLTIGFLWGLKHFEKLEGINSKINSSPFSSTSEVTAA